MAEVSAFGQYVFKLEGTILPFQTDCQWANQNANTDQATITEGWCGATPGPGKLVVNVTLAVPKGSTTHQKLQKMEQSLATVNGAVQEYPQGSQMKTKGHIRNVAGGSGVGANASITFEYHSASGVFE